MEKGVFGGGFGQGLGSSWQERGAREAQVGGYVEPGLNLGDQTSERQWELLWSPGRVRLCCTIIKGSGSRPVDVQCLKSPRVWLPGLRPKSVPFVLLSCQVHAAARAEFVLFLTHSCLSSSVFFLWPPPSDPKPCLLELNPAYYSPSQLHDSKVAGQLSYRPPGTSRSANT